MAEQERTAKRGPESEPAPTPSPGASAALADRGAKIKKSLDEVLDDIDQILEANAEEFVRNYVQRGGQ